MDIWKYYDGDLKYPDIIDYFYDTNHEKQLSIHNYTLFLSGES